MSEKKLATYIGRTGLWNPPCRARKHTIRVRVTIEAVRFQYGRNEVMICPHTGKGHTWTELKNLRLDKPQRSNLY